MTLKTRLLATVATLACMGPAHATSGGAFHEDLKQQLIATYAPGLSGDIVPYVHQLLTGVPRDCFQAQKIIEAAAPLAPQQLDFVINGPFGVLTMDDACPNLWPRAHALEKLKNIPQEALPALKALIKDVEGSDIVVRMMTSPLCQSQEALNQIVEAALDPFSRSIILSSHQSYTAEQILLLKTLLKDTTWHCAYNICRNLIYSPSCAQDIVEACLPPRLRALAFEPYVTFTPEKISLLEALVHDMENNFEVDALQSFASKADEEDIRFVLDAGFEPAHRRSALHFAKTLLPHSALCLKILLTGVSAEEDAYALFEAAAALPQDQEDFASRVRLVKNMDFDPAHRGAALKHGHRLTPDNIPFVKACLKDVAYPFHAEPIVDAAISLPQERRAFIVEGQFSTVLRAAAMVHHAKWAPEYRPFLETLTQGATHHAEAEAIVGAALALDLERLQLLTEAAFDFSHRAPILEHGSRVTPAHIPLLKTLLTNIYTHWSAKDLVASATMLSPEQLQDVLGAGFEKSHLGAALKVAPHLTPVKVDLLKELMQDVEWSVQEIITHGAPLDEGDLRRIKDAGFLPQFRACALEVGRALTDEKLQLLRALLTDVYGEQDAMGLMKAAALYPVWQLEYALTIPCASHDRADMVAHLKDLTQDKTQYLDLLLTGAQKPWHIVAAAAKLDTEHLRVVAQGDFDPSSRADALKAAHHLTPEKILLLKDLFQVTRHGHTRSSAFRAAAALSLERLRFIGEQRFEPHYLKPIAKRSKWLSDEDILSLKDFTRYESVTQEAREAVISVSPLFDIAAYAPLRALLCEQSSQESLSLLDACIGKPQEALIHAATLPLDEREPYLKAQPSSTDWYFAHMGKETSWDRYAIVPQISAHMSASNQGKQDILARLYAQMTHPDPVTAKRTQKFVRKNYDELGFAQDYTQVKALLRLERDFEARISSAQNPDFVRALLRGEDGRPSTLPEKTLIPLLLVGGYVGGAPHSSQSAQPTSSSS